MNGTNPPPQTVTVGTLTSPFYSFAFVTGTLTITHGVSSVTLSTTTTVFETSTPVTWTAAVEPGVSGATPAGNLVFTIAGVARPPVPLDANGRGSLTVTWATPGSKRVQVAYAGDASFAASGTALASPMVVANTARATGLGVTETTFYPIVDGWRDTVTSHGTRLEPLSVSISVKNANGSIVRTFTARTASGPYTWAWNGRTSSGSVLPAGVYTITQTLADPYGSHPSAVKVAKVTLSLRKLTWSTVTVTAVNDSITATEVNVFTTAALTANVDIVAGSVRSIGNAALTATTGEINGTDVQTDATATLNAAPFNSILVSPQRRTNVSPRVDYQLTEQDTVSLRFTFTNSDVHGAGGGGRRQQADDGRGHGHRRELHRDRARRPRNVRIPRGPHRGSAPLRLCHAATPGAGAAGGPRYEREPDRGGARRRSGRAFAPRAAPRE